MHINMYNLGVNIIFEWDDDKAEENLVKHGVSFPEAQQAFYDPLRIDDYDPDHSTAIEERYTCIGLTSAGLVFVVYALRGERIRIIHARYASRRMERDYEEQNY